jgi:hypothetical protein
MFRVPDVVQWIVIASEREVIAELLRAPESTFSGAEANDEVSIPKSLNQYVLNLLTSISLCK